VLRELLSVWDVKHKNGTVIQYNGKFSTALKEAGVKKEDLPTLDRKYNDRKRRLDHTTIIKKQDKPIEIEDFSVFMAKIITGIRLGIDTKQCPMVLFLLSFVTPLRPNDMNEAHKRVGRPPCDSDSHRIVTGAKTSDGCDIVGTFVNMRPSKPSQNSPPSSYATVFLCDPEHYPLIEEAIAFVHDPEITKLKCTSCVREFIAKVPSGPPVMQEWGSYRKGIIKRMLLDLNLS
jgi:hypothetical protein